MICLGARKANFSAATLSLLFSENGQISFRRRSCVKLGARSPGITDREEISPKICQPVKNWDTHIQTVMFLATVSLLFVSINIFPVAILSASKEDDDIEIIAAGCGLGVGDKTTVSVGEDVRVGMAVSAGGVITTDEHAARIKAVRKTKMTTFVFIILALQGINE